MAGWVLATSADWMSPGSHQKALNSSIGSKGGGVLESPILSVHPSTNLSKLSWGQALPLCVRFSLSCCLFLDMHVKF